MDHAGIGDEKVYILGMQTGRVARHEKNPQCEKFAAIFLSLLRGLLDISVETCMVAGGKPSRLDQWCCCSRCNLCHRRHGPSNRVFELKAWNASHLIIWDESNRVNYLVKWIYPHCEVRRILVFGRSCDLLAIDREVDSKSK